MKHSFFSFALLISAHFFVTKAYSQSSVSGGSTVSGGLCTQGQVYTWGLNQQGYPVVKGTLGTGNVTDVNIPTPTQVPFPSGISIQQFGGLSGGYFLALDCYGKVWGWGDNSAGQLGVGNTVIQTSPQKVLVKAGSPVDLAGFRDANGQLQHIKKVFAGNGTSLAITNDGRLLSWGCNGAGCDPMGYGLLGDGGSINQLFPVFVKDGATNAPLQNVIDISIGDVLAMALVDEKQGGIGVGTVYTWGNGTNGTLGRNAKGTGNSGFEISGDNVARPVRFITNSDGPSQDGYLRNIVSIAAGDVAGYAIDMNGYVWAWGNGGWGGLTGQGGVGTHSDPRKVVKGNVTGAGTDGTYLLALSVAGGSGFAMAVTQDGKPVAWGNNGCAGNLAGPASSPNYSCGGSLGNNGGVGPSCNGSISGTASQSCAPVYILNNTGIIHNDVMAISRGDSWGYYTRSDNSVWAWGDNIVGQLGTGGYAPQNVAIPFNSLAVGCSGPDPVPSARILPRDTVTCVSASSPLILSTNFQLEPSLLDNYEFTWYWLEDAFVAISSSDTSSANKVKGPTMGAAGATYVAKEPGRYWLKTVYRGANAPCGGYSAYYDHTTVLSSSCLPTGVEAVDATTGFSIYPNPSSDVFVVETKEPLTLEVWNISGVKMETIDVENTTRIGESWNKGVYLVRIQGKQVVRSVKIHKR